MKEEITEFFFFSEEDLRDFYYDTHDFCGLRFFLELVIFLAVMLGVGNPKSCISFSGCVGSFLRESKD